MPVSTERLKDDVKVKKGFSTEYPQSICASSSPSFINCLPYFSGRSQYEIKGNFFVDKMNFAGVANFQIEGDNLPKF